MGFWDFLKVGRSSGVPDVTYAAFEPRVTYLGPDSHPEWVADQVDVKSWTADKMWRTQPHLRTVVSFAARNIAHTGVHLFERVGETDRRRVRDHVAIKALRNPGDGLTAYDLLYALVGDLLLYDRAYWLIDSAKGRIRRIPPSWVTPKRGDAFTVEHYVVTLNGRQAKAPPAAIVAFGGYSPVTPTGCSPTIESLKDVLQEQIEASKYRAQVWKRGGRISAVIERPADKPWSDAAAQRFREDWYANYTGDGPRAGGTPILEDGMKLTNIDFSATDQQWAEGVKLSFSTCASAFHINPTMVGILDNANFSNVREFRRMLYGDSLGPIMGKIEDVLNTFLLPAMHNGDASRLYFEFNIAEKLQGSFEEQTQALSSSVGRPWMTADEARSKLNMPALGGEAAHLVTPLNVLVGGQASPRDSGGQNRRSGRTLAAKARAPQSYEEKAAEVVVAFFKRQERVLRSALGSKAAGDWWDEDRWDAELAGDLYALALLVSRQVAAKTLEDIGFSPDQYDEDRTLAWLSEVSSRSASSINATTKAKIADALESADPETLDAMFEAQGSRALEVGIATVTLLSGFASVEAAQQVAPERATKTWVVTSSNPRASHASLDGETVPLSENFSNGAAWPGDGANLSADDIAGCQCSLVINVD